MATTAIANRLLSGPPLAAGAEDFRAHQVRLGELPRDDARRDLIDGLEASGLLGRGGAGFPVGRKWRAMAGRRDGRAVVVANGAEGEPASFKDRVLMTTRPHLVIDGAILAADAVGADRIVFYIGMEHEGAVASMSRAIEERGRELGGQVQVVLAPVGYVAGEATAAVNYINTGNALPMTTPPRVSQRGVARRPTLVQNVESLAYAALIARFGPDWYRSAGRLTTRGTGLVTVSGAVPHDGVREIELGTTVGELAAEAGAHRSRVGAAVLGGYFGTWAHVDDVWALPLDPAIMRNANLTFGCGIVGLLPVDSCGVRATAQIMRFMAGESAAQCGPCLYGLGALCEAVARIADGTAGGGDLERVEYLTAVTAGRGACHHPDGAVQLMASALDVFGDDFRSHVRSGRCAVTGSLVGAA